MLIHIPLRESIQDHLKSASLRKTGSCSSKPFTNSEKEVYLEGTRMDASLTRNAAPGPGRPDPNCLVAFNMPLANSLVRNKFERE